MEKKKDASLSDFDASFVISSFKNKERRNNPSMPARPLLPPGEREQMDKDKEKEAIPDMAAISNESDKVDMDHAGRKSDMTGSEDVSGVGDTAEETITLTGNTKRITARQRKAAFEEYKELYLCTPKIVNRKPVFISESTRDRLNKIARKLGDDNMSASGFLENLALHHLEMYGEDIEIWKKL